MTDAEHAVAIAEAHAAFMATVRAAWDAGLTVDCAYHPYYYGPWSLAMRIERRVGLAETEGNRKGWVKL